MLVAIYGCHFFYFICMIYILKTNYLRNKVDLELKLYLNSIPQIEKWSFDLEDIDKIFRVETSKLTLFDIIIILEKFEIKSEELLY